MENKFGLKDSLLKQIIDLAKQHNVKRLVLFGSRARGDFKRKSDIDLAVLGENISRFASDVDEMTDTLLKYDIVDNTHSDRIYHFPFIQKVYITDKTKITGELEKGTKVEVQYNNLNNYADGLILNSIKAI